MGNNSMISVTNILFKPGLCQAVPRGAQGQYICVRIVFDSCNMQWPGSLRAGLLPDCSLV